MWYRGLAQCNRLGPALAMLERHPACEGCFNIRLNQLLPVGQPWRGTPAASGVRALGP